MRLCCRLNINMRQFVDEFIGCFQTARVYMNAGRCEPINVKRHATSRGSDIGWHEKRLLFCAASSIAVLRNSNGRMSRMVSICTCFPSTSSWCKINASVRYSCHDENKRKPNNKFLININQHIFANTTENLWNGSINTRSQLIAHFTQPRKTNFPQLRHFHNGFAFALCGSMQHFYVVHTIITQESPTATAADTHSVPNRWTHPPHMRCLRSMCCAIFRFFFGNNLRVSRTLPNDL